MKQYFYWLLKAKIRWQYAIAPLLSLVAATVIWVAPVLAVSVYDLPSPNAKEVWVIDQADAISLANQNKLGSQFKKLAEETGQEIRMVAIRRLDYGETIDSFADELFTKWYPSPETRANQTLLAIDTLSNNATIRTGSEASKLVSRETIRSIVDETIAYNLKSGDKYNQALLDASDRLTAVLSGEEDPGPPLIAEEIQTEGTFTKAEDTDAGSATIWVIGLLIVATVIPMATYFWYVGFPGS